MRSGGFDKVWPRRRKMIPAREDFLRGFIDPGWSALGTPSALPEKNLGLSEESSVPVAE